MSRPRVGPGRRSRARILMEFERHASCASHEWVSDDPWSRGGRGRPKEEDEPAVDGGGGSSEFSSLSWLLFVDQRSAVSPKKAKEPLCFSRRRAG